jgi:catechol 2,3-dioxygenase-like lactoylglutathione lyase family enzyme
VLVIQGFHHLVLFCRDTEASKRWYESVGFEYLRGYHGMHWFRLGDGEVMLHPAENGSGGRGTVALHAAVTDVDALYRHVVECGLEPLDHQSDGTPLAGPVTRPWGDREFELCDPDGHNWAFTQAQ